jgi:hypothetical protein
MSIHCIICRQRCHKHRRVTHPQEATPDTGQFTLDGSVVASRAHERDSRPVRQLDLETYLRDRRALADWTGDLPPDISDDRP